MLCEKIQLIRLTSVVLRNLDIDTCSKNPCRFMKQNMAGQFLECPTLLDNYIFGLLLRLM